MRHVARMNVLVKCLAGLILLASCLLVVVNFWTRPFDPVDLEENEFRLSRAVNFAKMGASRFEDAIVPNYVHYVLFDGQEMNWLWFMSIKSVLEHQKPTRII